MRQVMNADTGADIGTTIVHGCGPVPNRVLLVGEAPGETEAAQGEPFVGRAGAEQDAYLRAHGVSGIRAWYRTNIIKTYIPGNPDPTRALIDRWTPVLVDEIARVQPSIVLAVGAFATRWFLGDDADMDTLHGCVQRSSRVPAGTVVIPIYHPAAGFYDDEIRPLIAYDYGRAVAAIKGKIPLEPTDDAMSGHEEYLDIDGRDAVDLLSAIDPESPLGIDTEGVPAHEWSFQFSTDAGNGYVLRRDRGDFAAGIAALQSYINHPARPVIAIHNAMYDFEMSSGVGLDLFEANIFDSMYAAYIMRVEPQGLKPLAYRWAGMRMGSYADTVGQVGLDKQLDYLGLIASRSWDKPSPRIEYSNDGTSRLYTPQPVERRAESILVDYWSGKLDKDGNRTDPHARWRKVDRDLREMVEAQLGPMPIGTLADITLPSAITYAARDPDATLRLYHRLSPELARLGLTTLMADGMAVLPVFEEMQRSGIPASRPYFENLNIAMWERMSQLQSRISHRYWQGRAFNPASADQVATLMRRRGLVGEKRSKKTGKVSTAKKSVEHLRYTDDAMSDIITWREHAKIRDAFCAPVLERIPSGIDIYPVRCTIKTTRVTSRRISASNPNLTAIPVRNDLGTRVRDGYQAAEGELFGSWDLSAAEMRVMAGLSKDALLCRLFLEHRDPHAETAARIFGVKLADVREMDHRYPAKRAAFGIITNIQGPGLLDQLRMFGCKGWDEDSCNRLIVEWLKIYKGVSTFLNDCRDEVKSKGVVYDYWGMPRHLPGVWSHDHKIAAEAERAASSHKIQGGAQGMIQRSTAWLKPYIRALQLAGENVRWLLQIHDSLMLRFDAALWGTIDPMVMEALTQHGDMDLGIPMEAKGAKALTWGKLK